jgi:AcrR family transcriptional regulator
MPKIVDHPKRREEIALVACKVVADHGFEHATVARIARAAGYTTGMVAHYYDSKQDIILAALRLILRRIEQRLTRERASADAGLLPVLAEALPVDAQRFTECAFWMAFWGQVPADKKLKRLNAWVHREYMRLFARCYAKYWPEWTGWPTQVRGLVLRSLVTFINGLTAGAVTSPRDWPAAVQIAQLDLQLELLRRWAKAEARRSAAAKVDARESGAAKAEARKRGSGTVKAESRGAANGEARKSGAVKGEARGAANGVARRSAAAKGQARESGAADGEARKRSAANGEARESGAAEGDARDSGAVKGA